MTEPEYCADCRDLGQTVLVIHRVGKRGVCATHYRSRLGQWPPAPKETSMTDNTGKACACGCGEKLNAGSSWNYLRGHKPKKAGARGSSSTAKANGKARPPAHVRKELDGILLYFMSKRDKLDAAIAATQDLLE
jgi:hypothetical protein